MTTISLTGRLAVVALPAMLLMACAEQRVPQMNHVDMTGNDFNHYLARDYRDLANYESDEMYDMRDAVTYADRATASAAGTPPAPDDMAKRRIADDGKAAELRTARARLMTALAAGAPQGSPRNAASAQSNFDCWVEQQEEGHQQDHIAACKDGFWRAMLATETAMAAVTVQPPVATTPPPVAAAPAPAMPQGNLYRVFFDWDRSGLSVAARQVIDQAVQRARASNQGIHLIGHADSSGTDAYNMGLSERRAATVARYLTVGGIGRNAITSEARGQRDALVATADGVREPQNRYVSIELMTRRAGM
jgi:OOP family OmpA-OmpF porin